MAGTILRLGWTNPLTDVFGAHPQLGAILDLNDGMTFTLVTPDGLELAPPPRTLALAGNVRTQGERATRAIYHRNRRVSAQVILGEMGGYADLVSNIRALVAWLDAPPTVPFTVMYQPIGASAPVYLDVVGAAHDIPEDEGQWLRLQLETIEIVFIARPGLRGDRVTLQNLVVNPGFGAGSGPGVQVFADTFATLNAYTVQSGSAPTQNPANGYPDIVGADTPLRYYRLDESGGTTLYDVGGAGANLTTHGSPTLGVAGAISGDSDTAVTFASGSSQYASSTSATGLPTGSGAWSLECWLKIAAAPAARQEALCIGTAGTSLAAAYIAVQSSGKVEAGLWTASVTSSAALTTGVWHHIAVTSAGGTSGTITLYVDGVSQGTTTATGALAYTSNALCVGVQSGAGTTDYLSGSVDEAAVYGTALSSTRVSAHYSAGHSGVTGTTLAFGSPAWGAINGGVNQWQARFRWAPAGSSPVFYLMLGYADSADQVFAQVSGTALRIFQRIGGTATQLASATVSMTAGAWYWAQVTLFPAPGGASVGADAVSLQVVLLTDNAGAVGAPVATVGPIGATSAASALAQPRIEALTAAVVIGGAYANVHTVSLFGPGGWTFQPLTTGATATTPASGAWEQTPANTYGGGPVTSIGAARIDLPPAGTVDACWRLYTGGAPLATWAIPVASAGNVFGLAAWAKTSGLAANAQLQLRAYEYDVNGSYLRQTTVATLNGNQAAWTQLSGTLTTGASTAYLDVMLRVLDTTVAGESANASVWFDNTQVWNQTTTGQSSMPYCELRFPQGPAQLVVSGLLGDLPAPTQLALGTLLANWPTGATLAYAVGRMGQPSATARLVGPSYGWYDGTRPPPLSTPALDPASYGGYSVSAPIGGGWNPRAFSFHPSDQAGTYHLLCRFLAQQSVGNLPNVSVRVVEPMQLNGWYGLANQTDLLGAYYGPYSSPLTQSEVWTVVDGGQVAAPPFNQGALTDPTQNWLTPRTQWLDITGGGSTGQINWQMLLPVDGSLVMGALNNPSNGPAGVTNEWLWAYVDGLLSNRAGAGDGPAWTYSLEAGPQPNAAHGGGGPGTQTTGQININSGADPYLTLDPTSAVTNAGVVNQGVNVLAGYLADGAGDVLPFYGEVTYSPLYLYPR